MRLLLVILILIAGCAVQPPPDQRAADCVAMTFAYRNITREARGPVRVTLDDQTDDYRDLGVYEITPDGLKFLGAFRIWNDRRMEFTDPATGIRQPAGWCDGR